MNLLSIGVAYFDESSERVLQLGEFTNSKPIHNTIINYKRKYRPTLSIWNGVLPVSYTHLDVYKRQSLYSVWNLFLTVVHYFLYTGCSGLSSV